MAGKRPKQRRAVGPRLRLLLHGVLGAFVLLTLNALYLLGVRFLEYQSGQLYQDHVYQFMFLGHLALGLLIVVPVVLLGLAALGAIRATSAPVATRTSWNDLVEPSICLLPSGQAMRIYGASLGARWMGLSRTRGLSSGCWQDCLTVAMRAGYQEVAETHRKAHQTYKRDDQARELGGVEASKR